MTSATADHDRPADPSRGSHLSLVRPSDAAPDTKDAVRLVPAGTPAPDGWQSVTVAAEPDANGVHQPSWEVQFATAAGSRRKRLGRHL